jgi:hypothetical protein
MSADGRLVRSSALPIILSPGGSAELTASADVLAGGFYYLLIESSDKLIINKISIVR